MRRFISPFNGKQFVLNKSTGEIHDLDRETSQCQIDEIKLDNLINCNSYEDAAIRAAFLSTNGANGCYYCNLSKNNG